MAATFQGVPCKRCCRTVRYERDKKCVHCVRARDRTRNKNAKRRKYDRKRNKLPHRKALQKSLVERGYQRDWQRKCHAADPRKRLLKKARERARLYGRECTLALNDIIIPDTCPLLGVALSSGTRQLKNSSPTIDRKDSSKGYVPGNVWVVSWRANRIKSDATLAEIKLLVKNWPSP